MLLMRLKGDYKKPPILQLPDNKGRFHLYSDASKFATGSALYQIPNGKPKLITYVSTRLPEAAQNYSILELELHGLAVNIDGFSYLLKKIDFDAIVDHIVLTHIIKSKAEPARNRMKRLLELLGSYSFNLYYIKGKDIDIQLFLFRQKHEESDPHEIIPISFNMYELLHTRY